MTDKIIPHNKKIEFIYRSGFPVQAIGLLFLTISNDPSGINIFSLLGFCLIDLGVITSAYLLQVYNKQIKEIILISFAIGVFLQLIGLFLSNHAIGIIGLAFIFVSASGLGGKEAYCFNIKEGWMMIVSLALLSLLLLINNFIPSFILRSFVRINLLATFLISASFSYKKFKKPYLSECNKL